MANSDDDIEKIKKELLKANSSTQLSKILSIPLNAKASIEIAIDRANAEARIKIIEADIIIKYGLLHKKKGEQ
ncbi:MAG: hypothetical protein IH589_06720 [Anaerolineales bacterium]|jgi:hypothetical protein|nr:hypothetical protein [Anaerolineales bacterium]